MSDVVIKVENLWKEYRLGTISHHSMVMDLQSWWARMRGKEDPNSQISSLNSHPSSEVDRFWALQDVSFEVKRGDLIGIIGRNGAGKSTLLKILSKVTTPTRGQVTYKGRIASLLEVGTGFHPELTGRENIFLNGAILGMGKDEIRRKFDEIVDFAEVEKFIDTPVKRYSSGMYVRLAFGVAAHLEPEILIVDEVLAVGDAQFQKKCLGKMGEVGKDGRTVLFVSHNMAAVESLCQRALLLDYGKVDIIDDAASVVNYYLSKGSSRSAECQYGRELDNLHFVRSFVGVDGVCPQSIIGLASPVAIVLDYVVPSAAKQVQIVCHLWSSRDVHIMTTADVDMTPEHLEIREAGHYRVRFNIPENTLAPGEYYLSFACGVPNVHLLDEQQGPAFEITDVDSYAASWSGARKDVLLALPLKWETKQLNL
ncbi:MAG: ATP-binding cassette domain-containing protein [Geobacteraceae bacterium]|nr:ATP-binding cassette domain-containing protein [Geobacteraceae bacterium]